MDDLLRSIRNNRQNVFLIMTVCVLYSLNNLLIKPMSQGLLHYFFVCYFNDLLAPVFMLSYSNIFLGTKDLKLTKPAHILLFTIVMGCIWEFAAPYLKKRSVTDPYDFVCYVLGSFLYMGLTNGTTKNYRST